MFLRLMKLWYCIVSLLFIYYVKNDDKHKKIISGSFSNFVNIYSRSILKGIEKEKSSTTMLDLNNNNLPSFKAKDEGEENNFNGVKF